MEAGAGVGATLVADEVSSTSNGTRSSVLIGTGAPVVKQVAMAQLGGAVGNVVVLTGGVGGAGEIFQRHIPAQCAHDPKKSAALGQMWCDQLPPGLCCIVVKASQVLQTGPVAELVLVLEGGREGGQVRDRTHLQSKAKMCAGATCLHWTCHH